MSAATQANASRRLPELTNAGLKATANVIARNEFNESVEGEIAIERALTIYLDKREIVTLMTLGRAPEALAVGYLRNQRLVSTVEHISSVQGDWETAACAITTSAPIADLDQRLRELTVTLGIGQGSGLGGWW